MTDTIPPPTWMTKEFLISKLKGNLNGDKNIVDCIIKPAVAAGDNYASLMFRVVLTFKMNRKGRINEIPFIVKTLPRSTKLLTFMDDVKHFEKEILMYVDTLPSMQKLLDEATLGTCQKFYPEAVYHQTSPHDLIILEDLCDKGFKVGDRIGGLDLEHGLWVMASLGRLHASSYVLVKKNPDVAKHYDDCLFDSKREHFFRNWLQGAVISLGHEVQTWSDNYKIYVQKLKALEDVIMDRFFEVYKRNENGINVVTHADPWVNNIMFKYQNDKIVDLKFIDFQLVNYNSPVLDLHFFIFSSLQLDVRQHHLETLLKQYYNCFIDTIKILNHTLDFTYKDFKKEFYDRLMFGFITSVMIYPIVSAKPEDAVDFGEVLNVDNKELKMKKIFQSGHFREMTKWCLPFFEENGIL